MRVRKKGFEVTPGVVLHASQNGNGDWVAWIEQDGEPVLKTEGRPRVFTAPTRYRAQCEAVRWLHQPAVLR